MMQQVQTLTDMPVHYRQQKRQFDEQAMAILMNPDSTPEQVKAVTDAISKSYGQDIISQACFEVSFDAAHRL